MIDEGTLRECFPEIPWDQPVRVSAAKAISWPRWVCRYCITLDNSQREGYPEVWLDREQTLDHIEREHHE